MHAVTHSLVKSPVFRDQRTVLIRRLSTDVGLSMGLDQFMAGIEDTV